MINELNWPVKVKKSVFSLSDKHYIDELGQPSKKTRSVRIFVNFSKYSALNKNISYEKAP